MTLLSGRRSHGWTWPGRWPTTHPSTHDIAWAAGIFEGEGHARRIGPGGVTVTVAQKDRWILDRLRDLFGGSVNSMQSQGHEYQRWTLCGQLARGFLMTVYTFLSPWRRRQVQMALDSA